MSATTPESAMPVTVDTAPIANIVQNTVERSASLILARRISASPRDGSVRMLANDAQTIAIPATP
jgi:hypothetical protein